MKVAVSSFCMVMSVFKYHIYIHRSYVRVYLIKDCFNTLFFLGYIYLHTWYTCNICAFIIDVRAPCEWRCCWALSPRLYVSLYDIYVHHISYMCMCLMNEGGDGLFLDGYIVTYHIYILYFMPSICVVVPCEQRICSALFTLNISTFIYYMYIIHFISSIYGCVPCEWRVYVYSCSLAIFVFTYSYIIIYSTYVHFVHAGGDGLFLLGCLYIYIFLYNHKCHISIPEYIIKMCQSYESIGGRAHGLLCYIYLQIWWYHNMYVCPLNEGCNGLLLPGYIDTYTFWYHNILCYIYIFLHHTIYNMYAPCEWRVWWAPSRWRRAASCARPTSVFIHRYVQTCIYTCVCVYVSVCVCVCVCVCGWLNHPYRCHDVFMHMCAMTHSSICVPSPSRTCPLAYVSNHSIIHMCAMTHSSKCVPRLHLPIYIMSI